MTELMHPYSTSELAETIAKSGEFVPDLEKIDKAIQWQVETFREEEGYRPNLSNDYDWHIIMLKAIESLGLEIDIVLQY